jgi:hypothetical protein
VSDWKPLVERMLDKADAAAEALDAAAPIEKAQPPTNDALRSAYESALEDVPVTITARGRTVRVEALPAEDDDVGGDK